MNSGINAYKTNNVIGASQKKLIIMLYEAIIRNLKLAIMDIDAKNIESANNHIGKAQDILVELMTTLDMVNGGDIARGLLSLYQYMYERTIKGNVYRDKDAIIEVISMIHELKETWEKI